MITRASVHRAAAKNASSAPSHMQCAGRAVARDERVAGLNFIPRVNDLGLHAPHTGFFQFNYTQRLRCAGTFQSQSAVTLKSFTLCSMI